jgi:5,10-methenyltetrahydromethanopterin hydrogenase
MLPLRKIGTGRDTKMESNLNRTILASELLSEASRVRDERGAVYGNAYENMRTTADLVSAYLGVSITADQMAIILALVKIARLKQTPGFDNRDSYLDCIAYLSIAGEASTHNPMDSDYDYYGE